MLQVLIGFHLDPPFTLLDPFFFSPPLTVGISSQLIKKQTQQKFILGILTNGFLKENYFTRNWFNLCVVFPFLIMKQRALH